MKYCGHAEIVYAFQSIEKKVMKGRIKESPWRSRKIVFGITVRKSDTINLLFRVIFRALHQVQLGLTAGWLAGRPNQGDFLKFLKFIIDRNNTSHFV